MATQEQLQPVAAVTPVATPTSPESVAPVMNTAPLLPTLNASAVYSPQNVQQVLTKSSGTYKKMKLSKLEKQIAEANSLAEMNRINIENTPVAMGVISGQVAQQNKLDTARLNAVTGLYNVKLADEQRKEQERQQFISTYGADPKQRPKGMSKREFAKAIQGGQFQNLLTEDFKQKQLQTAAARKSLSGGSGSASSASTVAASQALQAAKGADNYTNPYEYIKQRDLFVANTPGSTYSDFDSQFSGMLNPNDYQTVGFNPSQIEKIKGTTSKATQAQYTASGYAQRISDAGNQIDQLSNVITNYNPVSFSLASKLPSWMQSGEMQQYDQAARNLINAILRRESGAAIAQSEFDNAYKQYLPVPGDTPETMAQKKKNREAQLSSISNAAGSAFDTQEVEVINILTNQRGKIPATEFDPSQYILTGN